MATFKSHFYGIEISEYGRQNGYVDYATLAKSFDAVLNNNIIEATGWENWEQENGFIDHSDEIEELRDQIEELEDQEGKEDEIQELEDKIDELEEDQDQGEIFQYFIIDDNGARILEELTNEIVFYNRDLDMYVWGVTHYGTSWSYVLTDIPCEKA